MIVAGTQSFTSADKPSTSSDAPLQARRSMRGVPVPDSAPDGLLSRVIFTMLLALLPLVAIPYGSVDPWWQAAFECAVFALGVLWMVECLFGGDWRLRGGMLHAPLAALVILACVQTLPFAGAEAAVAGVERVARRAVSFDEYETWRFVFRLSALMLVGELLLRYTSSEKRLWLLLHMIVCVALASSVFGVVRQVAQGDRVGFVLPLLPSRLGYAQFISRNQFGFLVEMAGGLILGLLVGRHLKLKHLPIYIALLIPLWAAAVLSNSRGTVLAMFSQIPFLALTYKAARGRWRSRRDGERPTHTIRLWVARGALVGCLILVLIAGVAWVGGDRFAERFESAAITSDDSVSADFPRSGGDRAAIWRATFSIIKDYPVAGVGFGGYWVAVNRYHDASGTHAPQQAHNDYLELLASGGVIGGALFLLFVILVVRRARGNLQTGTAFRRASCLGALTGIVAIAVHSFVDFGLHATANAYVFTAVVVIAVVRLPSDREVTGERVGDDGARGAAGVARSGRRKRTNSSISRKSSFRTIE